VKLKGFIQIPILIGIIVSVIVLGGASYFGVTLYQEYQKEELETKRQIQESLEFVKQQKEESEMLVINGQNVEIEQE